MNKKIVIYSDGASRGNPGRGGFGAVTLYHNATGELRVDEFGGCEELTTNNRMELLGVITALESFDGYYAQGDMSQQVDIYTDSAYVIQGMQSWIHGWKKNNWITKTKEPVKNVDLWQRLDVVVGKCQRSGMHIHWIQVPGHAGVPGNERCDVIATEYADSCTGSGSDAQVPVLYRGYASEYEHPDVLTPISEHQIKQMKDKKNAASQSGKKSTAPAYSYVSLINGKITTYTSWKDCEAAVKGVPGVKFKKSISKEDEGRIIADFLK